MELDDMTFSEMFQISNYASCWLTSILFLSWLNKIIWPFSIDAFKISQYEKLTALRQTYFHKQNILNYI